jgi:hypothetical protein
LSAFEQGRRDYGGNLGIRRLIEFALTTPQFLFRADHGTGSGPRAGIVALTPWEIATRLSYFLWATTPDATLQQRAASGQLATAADVRAAAQEMMALPRTQAMVAAFHRRWLQLDPDGRGGDKTGQPRFDDTFRTALVTSGQEMTSRSLWDHGLDQKALFSGLLFGNRAMAEFYTLSLPAGGGFEELSPLGDQKRFGIITLPAVLANEADGPDSSPTHRGHFISEAILCRGLPVAPGVVPPVAEPGPAMLTTRQRYSEHINNPACFGCHAQMDPIGFGLENYDGYGRWRVKENGQAIDPSGTGEVLGKPFSGPADLADILANSDDVSQCLVQQWFRFAVGRAIEETDACTLTGLHQAFVDGGRTLRPLMLAIVSSEAFLTRRAP